MSLPDPGCGGGRGGNGAAALIAVVVLSGCVLLPYNCLLQSEHYFDGRAFKGMAFPFTSMISYSAPLSISQGILTFTADGFSVVGRMNLSFCSTIVVCVLLALTTIFTHVTEAPVALYTVCLGSIVGLSVSNSIMQTALLGLAGTMGERFSAAAMFGFGVCGLLTFGLSLLLDVLIPSGGGSDSGPMLKTTLLFIFCGVYTVISAALFVYFSRRMPVAVRALAALEATRSLYGSTSGSFIASEASSVSPLGLEEPVHEPHASNLGTLSVLRQVGPQATNVWLTFAVTMSVFPGVVNKWVPGEDSVFHHDMDRFSVLLTGAFQIFDVVGRYLAAPLAAKLHPGRLWFLTVGRMLLVPLFMLGQRAAGASVIWGGDVGRFVLVSVLALTNGFAASCGMMFGPQRCADGLREVAGIAMSCTMVTGIFCGTLLAFFTQL